MYGFSDNRSNYLCNSLAAITILITNFQVIVFLIAHYAEK